MPMLTETEWLVMNDLILKLNSIETDPEFRKTILEQLRILIPYESAAFFFADLAKQLSFSKDISLDATKKIPPVGVNIPKRVIEQYVDDDYVYDPAFVIPTDVARAGIVFRESDFAEEPHFADFQKKQMGGRHSITCMLFTDEGHLGSFNLNRLGSDEPFSERDVHILRILAPHIANRLNHFHLVFSAPEDNGHLAEEFHLSERELDVVHCIADGMDNSQTAEKLCITIGTVKRHLNSVFEKTGVESRTQLLALYYKSREKKAMSFAHAMSYDSYSKANRERSQV